MITDCEKKVWDWKSTLCDHVRIMTRIPMMLLAPLFLTAPQIEAVQSSVSDINSSNIGAVWHNHMKQISGLDGNMTRVQKFTRYGRSFGRTDGAGSSSEAMYNELVVGQSAMVARAAEAAAFLQFHMDMVGNTVLGFLRGTCRGSKRAEQSIFFEIIFVVYYITMYSTMALLSSALKMITTESPGILILIYLIHSVFAAIFIIPIGILSIFIIPVVGDKAPLPARRDYVQIVEDDLSTVVTYSIDLVKPSQSSKVGMRFGSNAAGQVMVSNIKAGSIASMSELQIGDVIFSINGESLVNSFPKDAAAILMNASGVVKIVASLSEGTFFDEDETV